jgi:hypothetical protein
MAKTGTAAKPSGIKQIHDLGPDTKRYAGFHMTDRFTVVLAEDTRFSREGGKVVLLHQTLNLGETPDSPGGFSQMSEAVLGENLGKRITWGQLPLNVRKHINRRLTRHEQNRLRLPDGSDFPTVRPPKNRM